MEKEELPLRTREALGAGVRRPLVECLGLRGEGVDKTAMEDCVWRRRGVHENLGILEGDVSSLIRSSEGRCLDFLGRE